MTIWSKWLIQKCLSTAYFILNRCRPLHKRHCFWPLYFWFNILNNIITPPDKIKDNYRCDKICCNERWMERAMFKEISIQVFTMTLYLHVILAQCSSMSWMLECLHCFQATQLITIAKVEYLNNSWIFSSTSPNFQQKQISRKLQNSAGDKKMWFRFRGLSSIIFRYNCSILVWKDVRCFTHQYVLRC
jgi:hypothetical protein